VLWCLRHPQHLQQRFWQRSTSWQHPVPAEADTTYISGCVCCMVAHLLAACAWLLGTVIVVGLRRWRLQRDAASSVAA
jgi:hypothetical protein